MITRSVGAQLRRPSRRGAQRCRSRFSRVSQGTAASPLRYYIPKGRSLSDYTEAVRASLCSLHSWWRGLCNLNKDSGEPPPPRICPDRCGGRCRLAGTKLSLGRLLESKSASLFSFSFARLFAAALWRLPCSSRSHARVAALVGGWHVSPTS